MRTTWYCIALEFTLLFVATSGFAPAPFDRQRQTPTRTTVVRGQQDNDGYPNAQNGTADIVELTPMQIKTIRKRIAKQKASKKIPTHYLPSDDSDSSIPPFSKDTISALLDMLQNSKDQLVECRGLSASSKRDAPATAHRLALELSMELEQTVFVVEQKGHAAVFYCPTIDGGHEDGDTTIQLRTTGKENAWVKTPKPLRDNAGQIIR